MVKRIGVFTSGGDAPGMNAAVRAVVRTALARGVAVYGIHEGYQGLVDGGDSIGPMVWGDVGGVLHLGGTVLGSARCAAFREREGRLAAARNLVHNRIDGLIVIGGDGSLTGASVLRQEWSGLLQTLLQQGDIRQEDVERHATLPIVGLIGSIDNDMFGSDVTIGVDTALHRIVGAIDAISSTAASHQRTFVVEVMGRHCGYLALMSALATGASWVFIPEHPPAGEDWETRMTEILAKGRRRGRRENIVILAEGARDAQGQPITSGHVKRLLEERLGEDTRITVLGHVQRGGSPSAYDRILGTLTGAAAVDVMLDPTFDGEPVVVGTIGNKITHTPLDKCLDRTRAVSDSIHAGNYDLAMAQRGYGFEESYRTYRTLVRAVPRQVEKSEATRRVAVLNAGSPAPGMNTAVRAAVRLGIDQGHTMLGVRNGFRGLIDGDISELGWLDVSGWAARGGAELGTNRTVPEASDFYAIARNLEAHNVQGLVVVGGITGYRAALALYEQRRNYPVFNLPIVCLPASINNNLPGADHSVGADTALNSIVEAVDKIKRSAVASRRVFVVEVMGRHCGYLALTSALATGAERVYLNEEGVTLQNLVDDVSGLVTGFNSGKRLGVMIRNEAANTIYSTPFMTALFEEEGGHLFDVRQAILGHLQQGGDPTPFDRILATRLAVHAFHFLDEQLGQAEPECCAVGYIGGQIQRTDFLDLPRMIDVVHDRPKKQWWLDIRPIARVLAQSGPDM